MKTQNFRNLKKFLGELTVSSAVIYSSVQEARNIVSTQYKDMSDPWSQFARKHDIILDGVVEDKFLNRINHLLFLNINTAFDDYFKCFKSDCFKYKHQGWRCDDKEPLVSQIKKNLKISDNYNSDNLKAFLDVLDYYKSVRNKIAHSSDDCDGEALSDKLNKEGVEILRSYYNMRTAPNEYCNIGYHDIKFFSRILLDFLTKIEGLIYPGDEIILQYLSEEITLKYKKMLLTRQKRANSYLASCLQNEFGIESSRCKEIVERYSGSLA